MAVTCITVNTTMLATLVRVDRVHMAQIRTIGFAYYFLWRFFKKLCVAIFKQRLVNTLDMIKYILVFQKLIVRIYLRPSSFKKIRIFLM